MKLFSSKTKDIKFPTVQNVRGTSWRRVSRDPFVDWIFMLLVSVAITMILIIVAVSGYVDVGVATTQKPDQTVTPVRNLIDGAALKSFLGTMEARKVKSLNPGSSL
jgi:hypothetical protein